MADKQPEVRMLVSVDSAGWSEFTYVIGRPVRIELEDGRVEHVRNISESGFDCDPLADLQVRCNVNRDDGELWGWDCEYRDVFRVDEQRAQTMAKLLGKVRRGREKLESELGFAESFAAYLARTAKVLGISRFGFLQEQGSGWSHDDNEYRWVDATYLRELIARAVEQKAGKR